jgi:ribonuclease Z
MEKMIVLGTGNAMVTKCYNTCFAIYDGNEYILVDAGGGNRILALLEDTKIDVRKIHNIFLSHKHTDHILGMIWIIRKIGSLIFANQYEGNCKLYCHADLVDTVVTISNLTLQGKFAKLIGDRIEIVPVCNGDTKKLLNYEFTFFDIMSTKDKQFGFTTVLNNGKKLTFVGDEPYNPVCYDYVKGSSWLLHEAFCLYAERDKFKPYEKHHSTVREASILAKELNIDNLVLWHTEDKNIENRKELYISEGKEYYTGNLYVPDDLDVIEL